MDIPTAENPAPRSVAAPGLPLWQRYAGQFPVREHLLYLNHAAVAPLCLPAAEAMERLAQDCLHYGSLHYDQWLAAYDGLRRAAARLINSDPSEIALMKNTSEGIATIAMGLDWQPGDRVVAFREEFPANYFPWLRLEQKGVAVTWLSVYDPLDRIDAACRGARLLSISFVQFLSGYRAPLQAIGEICKRNHCIFMVDAIQGMGAFPLDVRVCSIDALAADGHKWLLGPEGCAILYICRELQDHVEPVEFGWTNVANYNDYSSRDLALRRDAGRYEPGTLNTIGIFGLRAAIEFLLDVGLEGIAQLVQNSGDRIAGGVEALGYEILGHRTPENGAGIVSFRKPGLEEREIVRILRAAGISAAPRAGWVRASPHFYISPMDIDRFLAGAAVTGWLRRHPLAAILPLQALLYFRQLALLAPWFDEVESLLATRGPLAGAIGIPLHPPLYFLLLYAWQRIPLGLSWTVQARVLSVLFALAATVAVDRFWARRLAPPARFWFLALWAASPCLLLYCRMARSYSLQLLLAAIAAGLILDAAAKPARARFWAMCGALAALLYVHYVPGLAMLAAANLALARARRWRVALAADGVVVLAFLPWLPRLVSSLRVWGAHSPPYALSGSPASEIAVKLAYWAMSFTLGESLPDGLLLAGVVFAAAAGLLLLAGLRRHRDVLWILLPAAAIGFVGVMRWVSYPFIPARMLFTLPLFLGPLAAGARSRAGQVALAGLLAISISGVWCYFQLAGFRNKQYPMPLGEIAGVIQARSTPADSAILVDSTNSDSLGLRYALGPDRPILSTADPETPRLLAAALSEPRIHAVWFLRNTHDVSPSGLNARFGRQLGALTHVDVHSYQPFTPLERNLQKTLGIADPPAFFTELLEYRR